MKPSWAVVFLSAASVLGDVIVDPGAHNKLELKGYHGLAQSSREIMSTASEIGLLCGGSEICGMLEAEFRQAGLTVKINDASTSVSLSVKAGNIRHWKVEIALAGGPVVNEVPAALNRDYYADRMFEFALNCAGAETPVMRQSTLAVVDAKPDTIKPVDYPGPAELAADVACVVSALMNRFGPLEARLNSPSSGVRKEAVDLIEAMANPSTKPLLEQRLEKEKDRALKRKIKKAASDLE